MDGREPGGTDGGPVQRRPATAPRRDGTHDIDLTDVTRPGEVIAEWFDDQPAPPNGAPARSVESRIGAAQRAAERAIEQSKVPPRYQGLMRRYFGRLDGAVRDASGGGAAPRAAPPPSTAAPATPASAAPPPTATTPAPPQPATPPRESRQP